MRTRVHAFFAAVLALGAAGCPSPPKPCAGQAPPPPPFEVQLSDQVGLAGQQMIVTLSAPMALTCLGAEVQATSAVGSVTDWAGARVDSTTMLITPEPGTMRAQVQFTPKKPGLYDLVVRFEPALTHAHASINIAEDRRDAGTLTFSIDRHCDQLRTLADGVLCWSAEAGGAVSFISDGGTRWAGGAISWAPATDGVWTVDFTGIASRYVMDDGGLVLAGTCSTGNSSPIILADDQLAVVAGSLIEELAFSDAGVVVSSPAVGDSLSSFAQWVPGEGVLAATMLSSGFCTLFFDGGSSCTMEQFNVLASSRDGIWFGTGQNTLVVERLDPGGQTARASTSWNVQNALKPPASGTQGTLVLTSDNDFFVPRVDRADDRVVLEAYGQVPLIWADDECVWVDAGVSQVTCVHR